MAPQAARQKSIFPRLKHSEPSTLTLMANNTHLGPTITSVTKSHAERRDDTHAFAVGWESMGETDCTCGDGYEERRLGQHDGMMQMMDLVTGTSNEAGNADIYPWCNIPTTYILPRPRYKLPCKLQHSGDCNAPLNSRRDVPMDGSFLC